MNLTPAQAVDAYRAALPPGELLEFALTPLDRLGIPVQALSFFPANEGGNSGLSWPLCEGIGYGETPEAARVGAYGELTEEVSSSAALSRLPRLTGSCQEMVARHGAQGVVDPVTLCLEAGSSYTPDTVLEWIEARRWSTDEPVLIPAEFVACAGMDVPPQPGISRLVTPITNGHGAGTTLAMAQSHGLLELLQRDGNSVHYRALAGATAIDLATVTDPAARALLDRYDAAGIEIIIKVAATDFGFVNLYVVGYDRPGAGRLPVMAAACGEAVHPVPEIALRKALLEFASSRARLALFHGPLALIAQVTPPGYLDAYRKIVHPADEEPSGLAGMQHWVTLDLAGMREVLASVFAVDARVSFLDLPRPEGPGFALDHAAVLRFTVTQLERAGFEVLCVDLSPSGAGGIHAVKMIVPGLEVETMSYRRIGERNLRRLLVRQAADADFPTLAGIGGAPAKALPVPLTAPARHRLGGDAWLDPSALATVMQDLYVLYREPSRHVTAFSCSDSQHNCQAATR